MRTPNRLVFLPLLTSACFERRPDCDVMDVVSVEVTVRSSSDAPMEGVQVWFTGPGDPEPQLCDDRGSTWTCGDNVAGEILIQASADCHGLVSETVVVPENACHVEQQELRVLLDPEDCTQEELPSVYLTVHNEDGEAIADASPGFVPADQDWTDYQPCELWDDGWACGWGWVGDIALQVEAEGYSTWTGGVTVGENCCGVVTQDVDAVLLLGG